MNNEKEAKTSREPSTTLVVYFVGWLPPMSVALLDMDYLLDILHGHTNVKIEHHILTVGRLGIPIEILRPVKIKQISSCKIPDDLKDI